MSIGYILTQAGNKMGLSPDSEQERTVLLRFLNEATDELYAQADLPNSIFEQVFKVNGDQTIALPPYVGFLRAAREKFSQVPWKINQLRPRYNVSNWPDMWRNFRLKGQQALKTSIRNEAQVVVTVSEVETPNVVVTITGSTDVASSITEDITLSSTSVTSVHNFTEITSVTKDRINNFDITISDVDGLELAVIPNNEKRSSYQIIDVSVFPWLNQDVSTMDHWMEILYKKTLPWFSEDGEQFVDGSYDNIVVNKMLQLWAEEKENTSLAAAYDGKATRSLARKVEEQNRETEDKVAFIPNGHDMLLTKVRKYRRYRYGAGLAGFNGWGR